MTAFTDSEPFEGGPITLEGVWVHDPLASIETVQQFRYGKAMRSTTIDTKGVSHVYAGREFQVVNYGEHTGEVYAATVQVPFDNDWQLKVEQARAFGYAKRQLVFRDNRGRAMHGVLVGYNENDTAWGTEVVFSFERVDTGSAVI